MINYSRDIDGLVFSLYCYIHIFRFYQKEKLRTVQGKFGDGMVAY